TRAILHLTINSLPTWHNNHLYFLIKNGEKIEETYTPESGNTGSLDLILIAYSEELYKSEIPADPHPCPYKVKKYLFPVRGVKGITVNQIGDYWIDITDLLNYLIGQRDSKYKFGLMPAFLLDDFVSTQTDKRHLLALRNQTITINTCKSWFDIECNYYFEVDYEWQYIEADLNAFTMNACYFTFELDEAIYQRNLMYNAPPSNID
ncbi:hypothetical protein J7M23_12880, partial [Candidatus Sumerlaeota bacterium]|nr:hypothetical protein [Candidatus Sumerlaeota bacterium]